MRLYSGQFNIIAEQILRVLMKEGLLEVEPDLQQEAELDVVGVLREYNRMDRELGRRARDMAAGDGRGAQMNMKRRLAKEKGFKLGDDGLEYIVNQIIETFMQSRHIEEIYGTDRELRSKITPIMKKFTESRDDELDREVRSKIRNLKEGSQDWDIEYERVMQRVQDKKGLCS